MKKLFSILVLWLLYFTTGCDHEKLNADPTNDEQSINSMSKSTSETATSLTQLSYNYIPIVVVLYDLDNYGGRKRILYESVIGFDRISFDNDASSMVVYKGPDYEAYKAANNGAEPFITLYEHKDATGAIHHFTVGKYPNFDANNMNFKNKAGAASFCSEIAPVFETSYGTPETVVSQIHGIVKLYSGADQTGYFTNILITTNSTFQKIADFSSYFDGDATSGLFHNTASSYEVFIGPNPDQTHFLRVYDRALINGDTGGNYLNILPWDINNSRKNLVSPMNNDISASQTLPNP